MSTTIEYCSFHFENILQKIIKLIWNYTFCHFRSLRENFCKNFFKATFLLLISGMYIF